MSGQVESIRIGHRDCRLVHYGYWREREDDPSPLPFPVAGASDNEDVVRRVLAVERFLMSRDAGKALGGVSHQMGKTRSRLTGQMMGSGEFHATLDKTTWHAWPEDYARHYLARGVEPDPDFLVAIASIEAEIARIAPAVPGAEREDDPPTL